MTARPQKTWRMSYWGIAEGDADAEPQISLLGDPGEIRLGVGGKSFLSMKEDGITISGGMPSKINVQGFSSSFKYAGMIQDIPWPLTMIPSTAFTPIPMQIIVPPLLELLPIIKQAAIIASSMVA